jgi:serine/threonine protein kinase
MNTIKQIDGYRIYLNQLLGKGTFGEVYIGISDKTSQKVAVKVLNKLKSKKGLYSLS